MSEGGSVRGKNRGRKYKGLSWKMSRVWESWGMRKIESGEMSRACMSGNVVVQRGRIEGQSGNIKLIHNKSRS